jgi:hypothetical protein
VRTFCFTVLNEKNLTGGGEKNPGGHAKIKFIFSPRKIDAGFLFFSENV